VGGELVNVGGDCYAAVIAGRVRLLVALKETKSQKKPWVGVPRPIIEMLLGQRELADGTPMELVPGCAFIVLNHIPAKTLLVIPIGAVARVILDRARASARKEVPVQFHITKRGYHDYIIKNDEYRPDIPITLFSLDVIQPCLEVE